MDDSCGDDSDLRAQVDDLLESDSESAAFLQPATRPIDMPPVNMSEAPADPFLGRRVGVFEIQELVAHGGMGAVYRAKRVDGQFEQTVAIKILKRGLDTDDILRRFTVERQVLARLEHPHIARLYDGGATDEGLPYLVMELVDGELIDVYCDSRRLGIRERVEHFCRVCHAVQFAHQNLIVHRDLKPGNIMVTPDGNPKLLDFGIAKVIDPEAFGDSGEPVMATVTQMRIMTPRYASPEQVRGEPATTATDVYSLGVILYELLCGRSPHALQGSSTPEEIEKVICDREPTRPSVALTKSPTELNDTESIAAARQTDVRRLRTLLSGDLETITLKALAKEKDRRYPSPEKLAEDLTRYLEDRPILARPDTTWYRTRKFVRRNFVQLGTISLFLMLSLVAAGVTVWQQLELGNQKLELSIQEEDIDLLADIKRVPDAIERASRLWPIDPRRLDEYKRWLTEYGHPLRDRAANHKIELATVASRAVLSTDGSSSLHFETPKDELLHETLSLIIKNLDPFLIENPRHAGAGSASIGTVAAIEWCRDRASELKRSESEWLAAWSEVRTAIGTAPNYGGLDVPPQVGLWPLGLNDRTGLFEFYDPRTGERPVLSDPATTSRWTVTPETAIVYILIPAATVITGATQDTASPRFDADAFDYEQPLVEVDLDAYFISKYEVTNAQWGRLSTQRSYYFPDYDAERTDGSLYIASATGPIDRVLFRDAVEVLGRLNATLPSEVQWEHAARGGTDLRWAISNELTDVGSVGNIADRAMSRLKLPPTSQMSMEVDDGWELPAPVGLYRPNGYGLHDTVGNVGERCIDTWSTYSRKFRLGDGARIVDGETNRMHRGGSFKTTAQLSRVSTRRWIGETVASSDVGIRPVRTIDRNEW